MDCNGPWLSMCPLNNSGLCPSSTTTYKSSTDRHKHSCVGTLGAFWLKHGFVGGPTRGRTQYQSRSLSFGWKGRDRGCHVVESQARDGACTMVRTSPTYVNTSVPVHSRCFGFPLFSVESGVGPTPSVFLGREIWCGRGEWRSPVGTNHPGSTHQDSLIWTSDTPDTIVWLSR